MSPGPRWVNNYFVPNLRRLGIADRPLRILSLWPDDASEAEELRRLGHACELAEITPDSPSPWSDHTFDIVMTGRLPKLAVLPSDRDRTVRIIYSALRPGGGLLVAIGNRLCPVDLSRNAPLLHGLFNRHCMSWHEVERLFLSPSGPFQAVKPLAVDGHFGWHRLGSLNFLGRLLEVYWKSVVTPRRLSLYTSPINPIFMLWIQK